MATLTSVGVASGVPNSGTGTASTLNGIFDNTVGAMVVATAAAVTAGSAMLPVTFPATGSTVTIAASQLGSLGQVAMATSVSVALASNQSLATAAMIPTGPIRAQKGFNVVTIATTTETVIATAVASTQLDLYGLVLANTSATATTVTINQATAGIAMAKIQVPPGDTRGFMLRSSDAIAMATAGNNITAVLGTSISGIIVTALYVKN